MGTGAVAKSGDQVAVNYVGELYKNGKIFDASWTDTPGKAFVFTLGAGTVIPGWTEGVAGMRVGGRRELIIPPSLAYGNTASGTIPKDSTLIFVIDLLKVAPGGSSSSTG
ncbi:MAG: FKBP-type peptidyl-prolyl cis-trans isomerase [Solirubrobacteraceae bacterium]